MIRTLLTVFALSAFSFAAQAQEDDIPPSPIVKTQLVLDAPAQTNTSRVWAGVQFTMPDHWHIYWKNPGDAGLATKYVWTLPEGITAGDIVWPAPERLEVSSLVSYGYSKKVVLPVPLTFAKPGMKGEIKVTAKWLVCKDICIPESATFTTKVPTQTPNAPALFDEAFKRTNVEVIPNAQYAAQKDKVTLSVPLNPENVQGVQFFPAQDGIISNTAPQQFSAKMDGAAQDRALIVTMKRGSSPLIDSWNGVLAVTRENDGERSTDHFEIIAKNESGAESANAAEAPLPELAQPVVDPVSMISTLLLAFLGGLILNIMPCVLPILALKALAIAKKAGVSRRDAMRQGIAYTVGVIGSFLLIAGGMLALKASGNAVGWGFQLQHAPFVAALAVVMVLVAANLLGWFELPVLFGNKATQTDDSTVRGAFLTGVLAVLVATPCTAPFMATAIGATLSLPTLESLSVFAALGFGMAAPFLLISIWPAARRFLPKPGKWMVRFKKILAVPMLATAAWLIWVFVQLQHPGSTTASMPKHETYSAARLEELRRAGTPVLLDATADWCLTCKINERIALHPPEMQNFFREHKVVLMVADWTASDPAITELLSSFGRGGVPLYVYYPPNGQPVVLPQILTPAMVRSTINPQP